MNGRGNVLGSPDASKRVHLDRGFETEFVFRDGLGQRGADKSGRDAVHAHPVSRIAGGGRLRQSHDSAFGGRDRLMIGHAAPRNGRSQQDNRSALLLLHDPDGGPDDVERRGQVGGNGRGPLVVRGEMGRLEKNGSDAVRHRVDPPVLLQDFGENRIHFSGLAGIRHHVSGARLLRRGFQAFLVARNENHRAARF